MFANVPTLRIGLVAGVLQLVLGHLVGEVIVDPFSDNRRNPQYWGTDSQSGGGKLSEQDGGLQFLIDAPTPDDYAERPWVLQKLSSTSNWSVQATIENAPSHTTKEQVSSLAIWVRPVGLEEELWMEFYSSSVDRSGFPGIPLSVRNGFATSLSELPEASLDSGGLPSPTGAVRITYIASEGILRAFHNIGNVEAEAEWIELAHHDVSGRGNGQHANVNWQLRGESAFEVGVYGYAANLAVPSGQMKFTSFAIDTDYVPVIVEGLTAVDDRAVVRGGDDEAPLDQEIAVLSNDLPATGQAREELGLIGLGTEAGPSFDGEITTRQGARVHTDGFAAYYVAVEGFTGTDSFTYTLADPAGATDWATVHVTVGGQMLYEVTYVDPIDALRTTLAFLLRQSSEDGRLIDLYFRHRIEILLMFLNNASLNGGSVGHPAQMAGEPGDPAVLAQEESGGEALMAVLTSFEPGLAALMTGQGTEFEVTQSMVDQVKVFRDKLAEKASPGLRDDIEAESARWNDLQDFVGKDFNEFATMLDIDPDRVATKAVGVRRGEGTLSVLVPKLTKVAYSLWRSFPLRPDSWVRVNNAVQASSRGTVILTDPDAFMGASYYRVEARMDDEDDEALR